MTNRQAALKVVKTLRRTGYQALFAGGCVRDRLLGRRPKDYDVATAAHPQVVMKSFDRTLKVGAKFGVVMVLLERQQVEVATFRSESGYVDGRRPAQVQFTDARADALRRDFTINGMFYDPLDQQVIDYVGGQRDLKQRIIRTIGNPTERFGEDYLRMLRAVRFATQLDFPIEPATYEAIQHLASRITRISVERIAMELEQILVTPQRAQGLALLRDSGLLAVIFPEIGDVSLEITVLGHLRQPVGFALGLAAALSGLSPEQALTCLKRLKPSRALTKHVRFLLDRRDVLIDETLSRASLRRLLAYPYFSDLYELQRAILKAQGQRLSPLIKLRRRMGEFRGMDLTPEPLLRGHVLVRLGATPGPMVGRLAEALYVAQLDGRVETREEAEKWVKAWIADQEPGLRKH